MRLIALQDTKPFLKRGKNDRADAEAISEAASRPSMRFVPVKSADTQAIAMVQSMRQQFVGQRTALVNALRGQASEFGLVVGLGIHKGCALLAMMAEAPEVPARTLRRARRRHRSPRRADRRPRSKAGGAAIRTIR